MCENLDTICGSPEKKKRKKKKEKKREEKGKELFSAYKSFGWGWKARVTTTSDRCALT